MESRPTLDLGFNSNNENKEENAPDNWVYNPNGIEDSLVREIYSNVIERIYTTDYRVVNKCADSLGNQYIVKVVRTDIIGRSFFKRDIEKYILLLKENFPFVMPLLYAETFTRMKKNTLSGDFMGENFIIMSHIEGQTIDKIGTNGLEYEEVLDIIQQITEALQALSIKGYVHRDIKPGNIFIAKEGNKVYLIDFDTLCNTAYNATNSRNVGCTVLGENIRGTRLFAQPNALIQKGYTYTHKYDLYSLGVVIRDHLKKISRTNKDAVFLIGEGLMVVNKKGGKTRKNKKRRSHRLYRKNTT